MVAARKEPAQGQRKTIQNIPMEAAKRPAISILLSLGSPWAGSFLAATIFVTISIFFSIFFANTPAKCFHVLH